MQIRLSCDNGKTKICDVMHKNGNPVAFSFAVQIVMENIVTIV